MGHWDFPQPHYISLTVQAEDIDAYGHVNNAVYLTWLDRAAWSHSCALGIDIPDCTRLRRGMAARRIEIDYLRGALAGEPLEVATWIVASDARLRVSRRFQVWRPADAQTLARAAVEYVCINLDTQRAVRMPAQFASAYRVTTAAAAAAL